MDNGYATTTASAPGSARARLGPDTGTGHGSIDDLLAPADTFVRRHIGPSEDEVREMLAFLGFESLDQLADATVPESIRLRRPLKLGEPRGEHELLQELKAIASLNHIYRSFIGMGYYDTITPPVIQDRKSVV